MDSVRDCADVIIVVDNGSSDRTAEVAREHGALVVHEPQRGYGAACLRGIQNIRDIVTRHSLPGPRPAASIVIVTRHSFSSSTPMPAIILMMFGLSLR
ncbi:MAG: glycosyltransferase [Candidatus Kapaibacterium sp.]